MSDKIKSSIFTRSALAGEIISRAISAKTVFLKKFVHIVVITLQFDDECDTIIYQIHRVFYDNFLKNFFQNNKEVIERNG